MDEEVGAWMKGPLLRRSASYSAGISPVRVDWCPRDPCRKLFVKMLIPALAFTGIPSMLVILDAIVPSRTGHAVGNLSCNACASMALTEPA